MDKIDLRIIKTKASLYNALVNLMAKKTFEEIKVSEICEEAIINRSTFYTHFEDKYDLFNSFVNDMKDKIRNELNVNENILNGKEYYIKILEILLKHVEENKIMYTTMIINNRNSIVTDILYETIKEDEIDKISKLNSSSKISAKFIYSFYSGAIYHVVLEWIKSGCKENPEELVENISKLLPNDLIEE